MNKIKFSNVILVSILLILVLFGVFFRFVNLDKKLYWSDEAGTSMRISGYTSVEMQQQLFENSQIINVEELKKYQYPNLGKSWFDTIECLALEDPQNGPLYFLTIRFWLQWLGNSVIVTRAFSAFMSLLALPCIYWLCQELFRSAIIGWVAIGLLAISPVQVLYAQEARPYSLWVLTILLSSATLLRAMRVKTKMSWGLYSITVILGLYTHLVFGLVAIGHGIYVIAMERFRLTKTAIACLLALLTGLLAFVPWIVVILRSPANLESAQMSWIDTKQTLWDSATRWAALLSRTFLDLGVSPTDVLPLKIAMLPLILGVLVLTVYAIYVLYRKTPKRIWLFVFTLIASVGLPLIVLDFVFAKRYGTTRYLLPTTLGIQLCFAYLLATKLTLISTHVKRRKLYQGITVALITIGIISCVMIAQADMWWNKFPIAYGDYPQEIRMINQAKHPLLLSNNLREMLMLSHGLDAKVRLQFLNESVIPKIPEDVTDVFLHDNSESLRVKLARAYNSEFKQMSRVLWKLENPPSAAANRFFN